MMIGHGTQARLTVATTVPRLVALAWAVWTASTAAAYVHTEPDSLQRTQALLHLPIWVVWAAATVLLVLGAVTPPSHRSGVQRIGAVFRVSGMSLTAGLLLLWGVEFMGSEMDRGWVSAKNYWALAACALASAAIVGKGNRREVRNG